MGPSWVKGKIIFADTGEPARGASVIIKGTTMGTITDANGDFILNVDGDPEIVISFVGYSTLRIKSSKVTKKPIRLELGVFVLDGKVINEVDHLDPETIERIEVIKDPDSELVKMYSAEDGVILITTKESKATTGDKNLEDIQVVSTDKRFDAPALEVFKNMPDWTPGLQRGKPVKVQVIVPVRFNADAE